MFSHVLAASFLLCFAVCSSELSCVLANCYIAGHGQQHNGSILVTVAALSILVTVAALSILVTVAALSILVTVAALSILVTVAALFILLQLLLQFLYCCLHFVSRGIEPFFKAVAGPSLLTAGTDHTSLCTKTLSCLESVLESQSQ